MTTEVLTAAQYFSRVMIAGIDDRQIISAPAGGMCLFGEPMGNGGRTDFVPDSDVIEFDVRKQNRGISSYVHRGLVADPLNKPKHVSGISLPLLVPFPSCTTRE